jgi:sulfoxide reductase heme-binding subunit YedZ
VRRLRQHWHRVAAHLAGILPLLWIAAYSLSGALAIPIRFVILRTGAIGLIFLAATLACTPVRALTGWSGAIQIRRTLGLYSFLYISLHLLAYAVLENEVDFALIWRDLGERRAMTIGLIAFLLLVPLAITSTRGWQRRLGRRWRTLHQLIYPAALLSLWHYLWLDRDILPVPLIYTAIIGLLLLMRLPWLRWLGRRRT